MKDSATKTGAISSNIFANIKLSSRLEGVVESSTLKMAAATRELSSKGVKVINFAAGEPDFPVPTTVANAAIEAIRSGFSKYTPVPGIPELRQRLSQKFFEDNGLHYPASQVVVSAGAKQSIFNFLLAVISPGDEVLIPSPYWVSYPEMVKIAGGKPVIIYTEQSRGFKLDAAALKAHLTPKTKAILLNSPSNPAGIVYSRSELCALASALEGTNVLVCSDEIYEKLVFEGSFCSFAAVSADAFARTVTVNGFSKTYSMTGWRLGYAAGPKLILDAMSMLQGQSTSGANSVTQKAALAALEIKQAEIDPLVEAFRRRRDRMSSIFAQSSRLSFVAPSGAFYLFLNVEKVLGTSYNQKEVISTSDDLSMFLLNHAHVGAVSGSGFGHDKFIRLSFAVSDADVEAGANKIVEAISELK